jgi:hypothetical protein
LLCDGYFKLIVTLAADVNNIRVFLLAPNGAAPFVMFGQLVAKPFAYRTLTFEHRLSPRSACSGLSYIVPISKAGSQPRDWLCNNQLCPFFSSPLNELIYYTATFSSQLCGQFISK